MMSQKNQLYLRFRVGKQWYIIPLNNVIEVLHMVALTELPDAPEHVLGLMTLRNTIMPVIDLPALFEHKRDNKLSLTTPIVAVRVGETALGLLVDDVDDVIRIPASVELHEGESAFVASVAVLEEQTLLILNLTELRQRTKLGTPV